MELTTLHLKVHQKTVLFMMSKIQNLNGTHNFSVHNLSNSSVVYDVKDTKFEWNSQQGFYSFIIVNVVYDVKDTKFEWNSQRTRIKH